MPYDNELYTLPGVYILVGSASWLNPFILEVGALFLVEVTIFL